MNTGRRGFFGWILGALLSPFARSSAEITYVNPDARIQEMAIRVDCLSGGPVKAGDLVYFDPHQRLWTPVSATAGDAPFGIAENDAKWMGKVRVRLFGDPFS